MEVACTGHHRQEGIQEGNTKKQKRNKLGQPHIIRVGQERQPYTYISSARQPRYEDKARIRTTNAPHSGIKIRRRERGTAIKSNKEIGKQTQGGASRVPDSPTVYHRKKTPSAPCHLNECAGQAVGEPTDFIICISGARLSLGVVRSREKTQSQSVAWTRVAQDVGRPSSFPLT